MRNPRLDSGLFNGVYPERDEPREGAADRFKAVVRGIFAGWGRPRPGRWRGLVRAVNRQEEEMRGMSDAALLEAAREMRRRLRYEGLARKPVARAFALVREAARRTVDMRPMDVQLLGGAAMLEGNVAEMETGEGKTLTATLPASVMALAGVPVHIVTVNDYLASRDAEWMGPVYRALGLTVGTIRHGLAPEARRRAYRCDVTYCTNKEVAFDYLRDRLILWDRPSAARLRIEGLYGDRSRVRRLVMRGLFFAIVDEADSVLIDEARTPLIISAETDGALDPDILHAAMALAAELHGGEDYKLYPNDRTLELTGHGKGRIADFDWPEGRGAMSPEQREGIVHQALVARHLFDRDKHYLVQEGKVQIIDEFTGRLMADRSWEQGLHQLIEIKEGVDLTQRKETRARITYQRFFRRYLRLAGMTGTAREVAGELRSIFRLRVATIPTNRKVRRRMRADRVYRTAGRKWAAVVKQVAGHHARGRPVLVGTRSVEASEHLSDLLTAAGLEHRVLNARQDGEEAEIIADAGRPGRITVATNMAGRGTDIKLAEGVADRGGLFVLATERHEARRIDRQLFGRCGRQGDPGTTQAIVSLEDELITAYIGGLRRTLARTAVGPLGGIFWARWAGGPLFRKAQKRAERIHGRMRRDLLKHDERIGDSLAFTGRSE